MPSKDSNYTVGTPLNTLSQSWDSNLQYSYPKSMERVANPSGDLLDAQQTGHVFNTCFYSYQNTCLTGDSVNNFSCVFHVFVTSM